MIGYIYLTKNIINDIIYIGKRQKPYFEKCYKGSGTHLKLAFSKYGKDKFFTEIIERCDTPEDLCEAEKRWIKTYRDNGYTLYNIADGGDGGNTVNWAEVGEEKKERAREKNRLAHIGINNAFYGKHHTDEYKEKASKARKGKPIPKEQADKSRESKRKHLKEIKQINRETGEIIAIWNNWCEASEQFKEAHGRCSYNHIAECCKGKRRSAWGYEWKYL